MQQRIKSIVEIMFSFFTKATKKALPMSDSGARSLSTKFSGALSAMVGRNFLSIDELRYETKHFNFQSNCYSDYLLRIGICTWTFERIFISQTVSSSLSLHLTLTFILSLIRIPITQKHNSNEELRGLLDLSKKFRDTYGKESKVDPTTAGKPMTGKSVAMIFQKRSTRTRVSTETGCYLLGGHGLFLGPSDIQLGVNESMKDTALVLSRFNSIILARVFGHKDIVELAEHSTVPVINALSDLHHPLQTLADLMALEDHFGTENIRGKTLAWVGDGNK
jgi:hypothetical protein